MPATIAPVVAPARGLTHFLRTDGRTRCGRQALAIAGWGARAAAASVACSRCSHVPAPARVAAADTPRDEITVAVQGESCCSKCRYYTGHTSWCPNRPAAVVDVHAEVAAAVAAEKDEADALAAGDDDDVDVAACGIFGHEPEGGRCAVCGEPDPAVAAVLADAAERPVTVTAEPGGFGAALGTFGFGEGVRGDSLSEGIYWAFDHATAPVRVVCYTEDGDRVALIGYDPTRPAAKLVTWKATFDGSTPQHAVLTALAAVLGLLPITR